MSEKICITGMGAISAAGGNLAETLDAFQQGSRNAAPASLFSTVLPYPVFEVKYPNGPSRTGGMRTLDLALCAVKEALEDAQLGQDLSDFRVGVCLGTTVASQLNDIGFYRSFRSEGSARMGPVDQYLNGNLAEAVARLIGARGPRLTVVNACSSGADAIGVAVSWLRNGICDIALAGGADEMNRVPLCGFGSLGILSQSLCAPFDRNRSGLNLGEGAGVFVLESEQIRQQRGKDARLSLTGYGSATDAYHLTAPRPDGTGLEHAIRRALTEAGIAATDVCFVNAHGTATRDNDAVEGMVLNRIFGADVKFLSTKGFTGHTLGAAGGLEAVFAAAALREGWIPESVGFAEQDDDIPIRPVTGKTEINGRFALSTSLAFGGNNAAIVVGW